MVNHEQFLETFLKHEANLRAFVAALVRNRQDCEDIFQETALTLWRKHAEYDPQRSFSAWAKGIAAKKILQFRDKAGRSPTAFSPEAIDALVAASERKESHQPQWPTALDALEKCAESLPESSLAILTLRYKEGRSIAEIAERLASSPAAMAMNLSRMRSRLHDCIRRHLGGDKERAP